MRTLRLRPLAFAVLLLAHGMTFAQTPAAATDPTESSAVADASVPSLAELGLPPIQTTPQTSGGAQQNQPSPSSSTEPSLGDLGFAPSQTQGNAAQQALLTKRTHMLKVHQTLGLITLAPMLATVVAGGGAKIKRGSTPGTYIAPDSATLDLHIGLGALTGALYSATAYYAWAAPKIPGTEPRGAIRYHRYLEYVHGPGMVLTGILGILAYNQEKQGQRVHGIAAAHGAVADVTVVAYAASILTVSWPLHVKFWEKQ